MACCPGTQPGKSDSPHIPCKYPQRSYGPVHVNLDRLDVVDPLRKPRLRPDRNHVPEPQAIHQGAVTRRPSPTLCVQRLAGLRVGLDVVEIRPRDDVVLPIPCRDPVPMDVELVLREQRMDILIALVGTATFYAGVYRPETAHGERRRH